MRHSGRFGYRAHDLSQRVETSAQLLAELSQLLAGHGRVLAHPSITALTLSWRKTGCNIFASRSNSPRMSRRSDSMSCLVA